MLQIGSITLDNWLIMAPMAGITNHAFRLMVKKLGAALVTTEMVSAMGLTLEQKKTLTYLETHPSERPLSVQIFGSSPGVMARAAQLATERGADVLDINMGCPAKKVTKTGAGSALIRNEKAVAEIVSAVRLVCSIPVTVKIRAGWSPDEFTAPKIAKIAEDCGADAVTVHPRFATQRYAHPADWSLIRRVKEVVTIPVIGNGDIFHPSMAFDMRRQTGCDGVMIGRGGVGNPWIFSQILQLEQGHTLSQPTLGERRTLIMEHFTALSQRLGEYRAARAMRGPLFWYTKGLPHSSRFREGLNKIRDLESLFTQVDLYFATLKDDLS